VQRAIRWGMVVLALAAGAGVSAPAGRAAEDSAGAAARSLDLYRVAAPPPAVDRLEEAGFDVVATRSDGTAEIVLGPDEVARLTALGFRPTRWRDGAGRSVADLARAQLAGPGPTVWKRWDGPGGLRAEIDELATRHPVLGREIVAVRLTAGADRVPEGARPAVLYVSLQHAREWISGEVTRRLLRSLATGYGTDPVATRLLDTTELWFVLVANPDGYEQTFRPDDRLWRKNLADNDRDGKFGVRDGVDLNRNFPDHWAYAPQGSSGNPADQTFRGTAAGSEPETKALVGLAARVPFRFLVNYHSFGRLILYPIGWQEQTPTADQPIYTALAGTPVSPAIPGYKPELSADLYPTNGETASWAHGEAGALGFTVELGEGIPGSNFVFPDNEALVEQEYQLNRPFALDVARSAADPARPVSHLGHRVPSFVVDEFRTSYGDPQPVQAAVPRRLGPVEVHWQVGDDSRLLVVVGGEHRQRAATLSEPATPGERLAPVRSALAANGVEADIYDVEAHGQVAPDPLGVLGHYEAVVWTAGDGPRADSGTPLTESVSRLANEEMLALRDYLNEGGRLLYMGRDAGRPYAQRAEYNPVSDGPCLPKVRPGPSAQDEHGTPMDACVALSGEFFQYWLGAYEVAPSGGGRVGGGIAPVDGTRAPFAGLSWTFSDRIASGGNAAAYSPTTESIGGGYPDWQGRTAAGYRLNRRPAAERSRYGAGTAAVVETPWSLLFGFGFEDIATEGERAAVMRGALRFLRAVH